MQRYYYKREPRQLIPRLLPNESLNSVVRSEDRWTPPLSASLVPRHLSPIP